MDSDRYKLGVVIAALIERRKAMEKAFVQLEDEIEDPYIGAEGWLDWHLTGEGEKLEAHLDVLCGVASGGDGAETMTAEREGAAARTKQVEFR